MIENPLIGDRIVFVRTRSETGGEFLEFDLYARPGAAGPPRHVHRHAEEHFEVIRGKLRAQAGGQEVSLSEGDSFTVAAGVPHTWCNDGAVEARVRVTVRPEAGMESFLETIYALARDGKTNSRGVPELLQLAVTAPAYFDTNHVATPPQTRKRRAGAAAPRDASGRTFCRHHPALKPPAFPGGASRAGHPADLMWTPTPCA